MAHELRTPLNAILGFGQLLEMDAGLGDDAREHVDIILRSGHHLVTVIAGAAHPARTVREPALANGSGGHEP